MVNLKPKRTEYAGGDGRRWLPTHLKAETHTVTVTTDKVTPDAAGLVPSGTEIAGEGLLLNRLVIKEGEEHEVAVVHAGTVDRRYLPAQVADESDFSGISFIYEAPTA